MSTGNGENLPIIVFLPVIICVICIIVLLDVRERLRLAPSSDMNGEVIEEEWEEEVEEEEGEEDDNHGEGSSTAVRVKKVGKKRGEKLKRKEQMRQYREYMDQQREMRRAQNEIYEQEFRQKKLEETIKRQDELEKRRKQKEKKIKQEQKDELKRQKDEEKAEKKRQQKFDKYNAKVKKLVQEKKCCDINEISNLIGLSSKELVDILKQLCEQDNEFELCLWSGTDVFLFITAEDYTQLNQELKRRGKLSIHEGYL